MQTLMESNKLRHELDAKLAEIKQLQMKLNGGEQRVGISIENLKEVNKALEKENNELKVVKLFIFLARNFSFLVSSELWTLKLIYISFYCVVETK